MSDSNVPGPAPAAGGWLVRAGNFWFHWRNTLFPVAFLLVFVPGPRLFESPLVAALVGLAVAGLGQAARAATIGFKYVIRGGRNRRVYAEDLVTDGLYRQCRNPMYVGNLLILFGVSIASNSWGCALTAIPLFVFIYAAIVAAEEDFLRRKFGAAYGEFCADVPRWLPLATGLRESVRGLRFHWKRVVLKEYGTPLGWIVGISLLAILNLHRDGSFAGDWPSVHGLEVIIAVTIVAWAIALYLKRSRTLVDD
jgi:protein-S-isoprenylcysteine O-methyltransferase Ste14